MISLFRVTGILILFPILSYAGHEGGNGGDAVVCRKANGQISSAILLDYYEASKAGINVDLGSKGDMNERVQYALKRLAAVDIKRSEFYQNAADDFWKEAQFTSMTLQDVVDEGEALVGNGCALEQVVVQQTCAPNDFGSLGICMWRRDKEGKWSEPYNEYDEFGALQSRYLINQEIWDAFDEDSKAGTILHEILVREFINIFGLSNTKSARQFNMILSSAQILSYTQDKLEEYIKNAQFAELDRMNRVINEDSPYGLVGIDSQKHVQFYELREELFPTKNKEGERYTLFADFKSIATWQEGIDLILAQLAILDPEKALHWRNEIQQLIQNAKFTDDAFYSNYKLTGCYAPACKVYRSYIYRDGIVYFSNHIFASSTAMQKAFIVFQSFISKKIIESEMNDLQGRRYNDLSAGAITKAFFTKEFFEQKYIYEFEQYYFRLTSNWGSLAHQPNIF